MKIKRIMSILLLAVVSFLFLGETSVNALENRLTMNDSGWWWMRDYNGKHNSWHLSLYNFGDRVAYCIEPNVQEGTDYNIGDWNYSNLGNDLKERALLIAYYGYDYPGHDNLRFRAATQGLLWELAGTSPVTFSSQRWGAGQLYDVGWERQEILNLVAHHYDKPSFNGQEVTVDINNQISITDTNNVLDKYSVYDSNGAEVSINGNQLKIKPNKYGQIDLKLIKKQYTDKQYLVYYGSGIQTMLSAGAVDPVVASVKINVPVKAKLKVVKRDKDTGKTIYRSGITFKIKNLDSNEYVCQQGICEYKTNNAGYLITKEPLTKGKYQLEEVDQRIEGYLWNKESLPFEINENSELVNSRYGIIFETDFSNKAVYGKLKLEKLGEEVSLTDKGYVYTEIPLEGVKFGLFASEDIYDSLGKLRYKAGTKISELITDKDGFASIENLYLGKYYIQELATVDGHVLDSKKYYFELKYKDQYTPTIEYELSIENYLPKGELEFTKTDLVDSKGLPNTLIEIYDDKDELVFKGRTDSEGKIVIKNLPVGKYYILEKEAPKGYILNEEKMHFEIKENGEIVKCNMTNERIVEVPNTLKNNYLTISMITLISLGGVIIVYGILKKNKKK